MSHATHGPPSWFTDVTGSSGVGFRHETRAEGERHMPEIVGAGVALFDMDRDGDLDLYFTNCGEGGPGARPGDADPPRHRLFRREANGTYVDVTEASGLGNAGYGMGVAVGDVDNDGDADVYVTNYGPDRLYRNEGDGTFTDVTAAAGIDLPAWSCSAAFFDYDRDGWLDLFVTQYVEYNPKRRCFDMAGRPDYCGPKTFEPVRDVLLRNVGDGRFEDVTAASGIGDGEPGAGLGVVCDDIDGDGWVDVYVANDGYPNNLWLNRGDGTFRDAAWELGTAVNMQGEAEAGMGVVAMDFDNDLDLDLFMTHLGNESNTLYRNLGDGRGFEDATGGSGLGPSSMRYTGFGTAAFDAELDGDLDIVVVNGRVYAPDKGATGAWSQYAEPNLFYLNDGTARFSLLGEEAAAICAPLEISRGLAMGDLDGDGDVDLVTSSIEGEATVYRNDAPRRGAWLVVRAVDPELRRDAIGARVVVETSGRAFRRTIGRGFSYLSSSDPRAHFGLGPAVRVDRVRVRWPGGDEERFGPFGVNRVVELRRGEGVPEAPAE